MFCFIVLLAMAISATVAHSDCAKKVVSKEEYDASVNAFRACMFLQPEATCNYFGNRSCMVPMLKASEECQQEAAPIHKCAMNFRGLITASGDFDDAKFQKTFLDRSEGECKETLARAFQSCGNVKHYNIHNFEACVDAELNN